MKIRLLLMCHFQILKQRRCGYDELCKTSMMSCANLVMTRDDSENEVMCMAARAKLCITMAGQD